jgi:hypothetical protein
MDLTELEKKTKDKLAWARYRITHREKRRDYQIKYRATHKEAAKAYQLIYQANHKAESLAWRTKNHNKLMIYKWTRRGVVSDDFQALYELWEATTNCDLCDVLLTRSNNRAARKCLDHCHHTGIFRNIVCQRCNTSSALRTKNL